MTGYRIIGTITVRDIVDPSMEEMGGAIDRWWAEHIPEDVERFLTRIKSPKNRSTPVRANAILMFKFNIEAEPGEDVKRKARQEIDTWISGAVPMAETTSVLDVAEMEGMA